MAVAPTTCLRSEPRSPARVAELTNERDRLWNQIVRPQQHIAELENTLAGHPAPDTANTTSTPATAPPGGLSRAERRRAEREQQRRQRHS